MTSPGPIRPRSGIRVGLLITAMIAAFAYGAVCVQHQLFPYGLIEGALGAPQSEPDTAERPAPQQEREATPADSPPKTTKSLRWIEGITPPVRTKAGMYHTEPAWLKKRRDQSAAVDPTQQAAADTPYHRGGKAAPELEGVTIHDPDSAQDGVNLVVSAHRPEATLCDMAGNVLHTWSYNFLDVWPQALQFFEWQPHKSSWRRVHVFPNGDLLAIFEGIGIIKLDVNSRLLWKRKARTHHDIFVDADGNIYTLSRKARAWPGMKGPVLEDFILVLSPDGEELNKVSILESFRASPYTQIMRNVPNMSDIFHTNTIELLDGSLAEQLPGFAKGNVLISVRNIDTIAVIDMEKSVVTWALAGMWRRQHQPTVLDNGHILVFDNLNRKGQSKVTEFDPVTQNVVWTFEGTPEQPFDSAHSGSCQRLPNGNTLITESVGGRAFEVTPDKKVVWEFINPHRAGENDELIAVLFEVVRLAWDDLQFPELERARAQHRAPIDTKAVEQLIDKGKK